jgi:hypothetical protein
MRTQLNWAALISMQAGVVPLVSGAPGAAKTAVFRKMAEATNRRFLQVILRQKMPEDLGGVPVPSDIIVTGADLQPRTIRGVSYLLGEDMLRAQHEPTLMLLDEFNHAGHDVMGAAQEWINNPPVNCWMAACQNPVEQSTSGVELSPPVVNRMCVLQWERPTEARRVGWRNGFCAYPAPDVPIVPFDAQAKYAQTWGGLLCDFEDRFPSLFGDEAYPKEAEKACEPWPSDRSWTNLGILMAAADSVWANAATRAKLVYGCVGDGAGNEFLTFVGMKDLPDPEVLLARPDLVQLPNRFDLSRAIVAGILAAVRGNPTADRWERAYDCLEVAFTQQPEVGMSAEGALWKIKPEGHAPRERNGAAAEMRQARLGS